MGERPLEVEAAVAVMVTGGDAILTVLKERERATALRKSEKVICVNERCT